MFRPTATRAIAAPLRGAVLVSPPYLVPVVGQPLSACSAVHQLSVMSSLRVVTLQTQSNLHQAV